MKPKDLASPLNVYSVLRTVDFYGPDTSGALAKAAARRLMGTTEPPAEAVEFCEGCVQVLHMQGLLQSDRTGIAISEQGCSFVREMKRRYGTC